MPKRMVRDWTDSEKLDKVSAEAERLFIRLIMKADDYGRFHANPKLVKSACFPLAEDLRANTVAAWLTELSDRQLVFCYTSGTGQYLAIINFRQRLKNSVAKFPEIPGKPDKWVPDDANFREVPGSSGRFRVEAEAETDVEADVRGGGGDGMEPLAPASPPIGPTDQSSISSRSCHDALSKALGKLSCTDPEMVIWQALEKTGCTLEDVSEARKRKNKNSLHYLKNVVCEERDKRTNPKVGKGFDAFMDDMIEKAKAEEAASAKE